MAGLSSSLFGFLYLYISARLQRSATIEVALIVIIYSNMSLNMCKKLAMIYGHSSRMYRDVLVAVLYSCEIEKYMMV